MLRQFPLKTSIISVLSLSLTLWGCTPQPSPPDTQTGSVPSLTNQTTVIPAQPQAPLTTGINQANPVQGSFRYDWSSDRIVGKNPSFQTQAFTDVIKAGMRDPAPEQQAKSAATSGGLSNEFAKTFPSSSEHVPNMPAVIDNTAYFLTSSEAGTNFFALRDTGLIDWQLSLHENNGRFIGTSPAVGSAGGKNVLYALTDQGRIYAVNADTGLVIDFIDVTSDEFKYSSPFVISDSGTDHIYAASYEEGIVYKYTFNGSTFSFVYGNTIVNSSNTGHFSSSPIVTGIGRHVYIGSEEGRLYKISETTGTTLSSLELDELNRSSDCQIKGTLVIDPAFDTGIVPCGSYLFKIRLNDASGANLGLSAQSPLLELRDQTVAFKPSRVLGPNINNRVLPITTAVRDPLPTETGFTLEQKFGFKAGDYLRVETRESGSVYATIDTLGDDGIVAFKESNLIPLPSITPDPFLTGGEKVSVQNLAVRPTPFPSPDATATPTPSPTATGADPVTQFYVGNPEGLTEGDYIIFPTLNNTVAQICSSTNANCDKDSETKFVGIEVIDDAALTDEGLGFTLDSLGLPDPAYRITVPGTALSGLIATEMASSERFVPFEKAQNRVTGTTNSTINLQLGDVREFAPSQMVRITHVDGSLRGRYEYSVVSSVNTSTKTLTLSHPLIDAPANGDRVEIIEPNDAAFGRLDTTLDYSTGNILSSPVIQSNAQHTYVQHGNVIFEVDYSSDSAFANSANYLVLQAGRLDQSNLALTALSRSTPVVLDNDKLITVDSDPSGKTGIFVNRVLLPLDRNREKLNDVFSITTPNSVGDLPNRAETRPVLIGNAADFLIFGGGNGVVYKLHKDIAW